jgi:hypothetical protein
MLTDRQIKWAMSHDWFLAVTSDGLGVLVLDSYVTRDGRLHEDSRVFVDFRRLRDWAGY